MRSARLTLVAMIFIVAMTMIDMTIVSIAAPAIQSDLHLSATGVQWIVTGYMAAMAAGFALGGRLADVVGRRTMAMIGALVFIGASVMCGLTPGGNAAAAWIIGFRAVQGVGAALLFPAALAIVVGAFPIERRGRAVAIFFGVAGGLTAIGPFVGGYLVEWSWRAIFWVNVPIAIIGLVLTAAAKPANERRKAKIDWFGALLLASGIALTVIGLQQASDWGWRSNATLGCIVGGVVAIGLFLEWERRSRDPLLRVEFFAIREFAAQNLVLLFASAAFVPVFFFASMYAQVALGWSASNAGVYLLLFFAGFAPGAQVGGRMLDAGGAKRAAVWGSVISAVGFWSWAARLPALSENQQWPWIIVAGAGLGMLIGSSNTDAIDQVPEENFGEATGVTQTARNFGASLGIAILGTVMASALRTKVESSLASIGVGTQQAQAVVDSLHGSGGGDPSGAISALGANADKAFQLVQADFAAASELAFRGLAVFMAISAVVAIFGLRGGRRSQRPPTPQADQSV